MGKGKIENLVPFNKQTEDEQKKIASAGGIASGRARRRKKTMREWAALIGALPAKVVCPDGTTLPAADLDADAVMQQYRKAHMGDTKAAKFIAQLKGQLEQDINLKTEKPIILVKSKEEADKLKNLKDLDI